MHRRPHEFIKQLRKLRRAGHVGEFTSTYVHEAHRTLNIATDSGRVRVRVRFTSTYVHEAHRTLNIATDSGRVCRPLIVVDEGESRLEARHLLEVS